MTLFQTERDCLFVSPSAKAFLNEMLVRLNELKITVATISSDAILTATRVGNCQLLVIPFDQTNSNCISRDLLHSYKGRTCVVTTPDDDMAALMDMLPAKALLVMFVRKPSPANLIDALGRIRHQANAEKVTIILFDDMGGRYALPANKPVAVRKPRHSLGRVGASCADMIHRLVFCDMKLDDAISKLDQYKPEQKADLIQSLKGITKVPDTAYCYSDEVGRYLDAIERHGLPLSAVWIKPPTGYGTVELIAASEQIRKKVRDVDGLFLSHAGEVCVLLPIHRLEDAETVAERLRQTVQTFYPAVVLKTTHVYAGSVAKTDRASLQKRLDNLVKAA